MAADSGNKGLFAALKGLVASVVAIGRMRLELLANEVEEEKIRLVSLLGMGLVALFLFGLGAVLLVVFLAAVFWEQRVAVFGISAFVALAGAWGLIMMARRELSKPSNLFRASLAELDADLAHLRSETKERL